jgi:hypothetical protein
LFDQRHRLVFSGMYQTGKLSGTGFLSRLASNWTFSTIVEVASGRPFNIITASADNFQFSPNTSRPNVGPAGTPTTACGGTVVASKFSPTGYFQEPCFATNFDGTLLSLDGNFQRNGGVRPWTVFNDLGISRRIYLGERINLDLRADIFNLANKFNVADVNPLFSAAGQSTAAADPRQLQFAAKINW